MFVPNLLKGFVKVIYAHARTLVVYLHSRTITDSLYPNFENKLSWLLCPALQTKFQRVNAIDADTYATNVNTAIDKTKASP